MEKLDRFIKAQENSYSIALIEIANGKKESHWMWYIFPQIKGLGFSEISNFYAISNLDEAKEYLNNEILGTRLIEISNILLELDISNSVEIFGRIDSLKLKSSMTLFSLISEDSIFQDVLEKFFKGEKDEKTIELAKVKKINNNIS